jgi:DeoR/GlpR family transcriptional regulator of sugar metabolism
MIHDSHKYGALTELRCAAELIKRDWHVAFPFVNQSAVDLIAFRESRFVTIQVKSAMFLRSGHARITTDFSKYKDVDFIICYDVHNRRWFIFESKELLHCKNVTLSPKLHERNCDNWSLIR